VRVAVIDSGIHADHPHIGGIAGGMSICDGQPPTPDTTDRIGHGTAVAAAIREKAPDAELYAVKVFDRTLSTTADRLVRAIYWAAGAGAHVINLSLGTHRAQHARSLSEAVAYAVERGAVIVAAEESDGIRWLPGSLPGVVPVRLDWACARESFRVDRSPSGEGVATSGFARPIPGVPMEANLNGISFAVANASGFVARAREAVQHAGAAEILALMRG
jgi:subtilisin family serine protease